VRLHSTVAKCYSFRHGLGGKNSWGYHLERAAHRSRSERTNACFFAIIGLRVLSGEALKCTLSIFAEVLAIARVGRTG
jgi:hypothetical protein